MSKTIDETGNTYGYLTVLQRAVNNSRGSAQWLCQCQCGNQCIVLGSSLRSGKTKSCGCYQKEQTSKASFKDVVGTQINNFLILEKSIEKSTTRTIIWRYKCLLCGSEDNYGSISNLRKQESCGCLSSSQGQRKIKEILENNYIDFVAEKRFSDLRFDSGKMARYDFYLPKYNTLIEYDGRQHFIQGNGVYDNTDKFEITQQHDTIKNNYAKTKGIELIRIPYTHLEKICLDDLLPNTSKFRV